MRLLVVALAFAAVGWSAPADALTVRDVIELTRAGLGEETLLALIDVDASVFPIDAATLTSLKRAGVTERVLTAMIRSGRTSTPALAADPVPAAAAPAAAPEPTVIVVDHHDQMPQVREVPVAVPIFIPVERDRGREAGDRADQHRPREKKAEPVYWGFGGKLRPDAWQPQ